MVPQGRDRGERLERTRVGRERDTQQSEIAGGIPLHRLGGTEHRIRRQRGDQPVDPGLDGSGARRVDDDLDRGQATGRKVADQELVGGPQIARRQGFDARLPAVQIDVGQRGRDEQPGGEDDADDGAGHHEAGDRVPRTRRGSSRGRMRLLCAAVAASYVRRRGQSILSPSRLSSAGTSVSVAATATMTTRIAPAPRLRKMTVGIRNMPEQRQHDGAAGEEDGFAGGAAGDLDRLVLGVDRAVAPRGSGRR